MRRRVKTDDAADVNVTPLLDIVFIMLIFFIVTATFVSEDGIEPNTPEPSPPLEDPPPPPPTLVLTVRDDGFVQVDGGRLIDPRSSKPVVAEFMAGKPSNAIVIISAAPDSESGTAITVLDQARDAVQPEQRKQITFTLSEEAS